MSSSSGSGRFAEVAKRLAFDQYEKYRVRQDREFESDFEREVKRLGTGEQ